MTGLGEERGRHPERVHLEGLMRGELSRTEARAVVGHLLTGCASCRRVTGRLWRLGEEPIWREGGIEMSNVEVARAQIREIVRDLEAVKFRLLGVKAGLLAASGEAGGLAEEEPPDPETEIRTLIECVLHDSLEPAIGDLREAGELGP